MEQQLRTYSRETGIKQICSREFKLSENDMPGGWSGYGNVKGYLDTHGTIMFGQCYSAGIPALLEKGFVPDAHGAAYDYHYPNAAVVGYFTNAVDDETGLWLEALWHSDEKSQRLRTKMLERQGAGKSSGLSIGFFVGDSINDPVPGVDYIRIMPQDYATEIPKYSKPEFVSHNLERAKGLYCVDILLRVTVFECSPTLIPSNEASTMAEVRGRKSTKSRKQTTKEAPKVSKRAAVVARPIQETTIRENTMAMHRDDEARELAKKLDDAAEYHEKMTKALKRAAEHHDEGREACAEALKHARKLAKIHDDIREESRDELDEESAEKHSKLMRQMQELLSARA